MSFRELRSFTETMKALGYPRLISMENFRLPNFELVVDCLYWLVQRYHPGVDIADDISTEAERVRFLQNVAQVMLTKARMKLNIKKLYAADGVAVKELLKVASLLYTASQKAAIVDDDPHGLADFSSTLKGFNPKEIKAHAAEILRAGGQLYDALGQEPELREYRARAVAGHVDSDFVQRSIQEAVSQVEDNIRSLEQNFDELDRSEKNLDAKIEKRKVELERNEKRLATLQSVRPAYMDEYERLQADLNGLYGVYLDRFRNLEYMESELESYYQAEQEKMEAQDRRLKKMQKRLADEELRILRGEQEVDESRLNELADEDEDDDLDLGDDEEEDESDQPAPQRSGGVATSTLRRGSDNSTLVPGGVGRGSAQVVNLERGRQVVGKLNDFDDDEASIDEDDNSDGGEVSRAGSNNEEGGHGMLGQGGYGGGADLDADVHEDDEAATDDDDF